MHRIRRLPLIVLAALALSACSDQPTNTGDGPVEGLHYHLIEDAAPAQGPIEVVEYFAFECPHCAEFEPALEDWLAELPADVVFTRVPAAGNRHWVAGARAFHVAAIEGITDALVPAYFEAVHQRRRTLQTEDQLAILFRLQGMDEARFRELYRSEAVDERMRAADARARAHGIRFTPSLVVDGRYRIEPRRGMRGWEEMLGVADQLIQRARAERGGA